MINTNHIGAAALVGVLSGTHASIWGMYKDAAHEGFSRSRFLRSVIVGSTCSMALQLALALPLDRAGSLVLLFGLAYGAERGIVEVWKTFVRDEDQSKYFIPMQFSIRGIPVRNRRLRLAVGAAYVSAVSLCMLVVAGLDGGGRANRVTAGLVGFAVGLIIAVGGGWKDAPTEGFDAVKFMRSPALTVPLALFLSTVTDSYVLMAIGAMGYERATAETYKTFFFPSRPRGKFSGMPLHYPDMLRRRQYFVPAYAGIWVAVIVAAVLALQAAIATPAGP